MTDETIKIGLSPKSVLDATKDMQKGVKDLAATIEESLGKNAVKSVSKLEDAAEEGTNKITTFFSNLAKRVKEDLKMAFDLGRVMEGVKFGSAINEGIKQVFDMEKAFGRLNSRLQLTGKNLQDFKKMVGRSAASTGQKLEDVLPGVEVATSKGGIRDVNGLSSIARVLGEVKATTGEDTASLADDAIEILKAQGLAITSNSIKATIDALQATRAQGAFKTAGEAGQSIKEMAHYAPSLGLGTREMGGLAAMASKGGEGGLSILTKIMEAGSTISGRAQLNATLGQKIFNEKSGKMDMNALQKVDANRFGNKEIMGLATGLTGANGQELALFFKAIKEGQGNLKAVVRGSGETSKQFEIATDNLASEIDKFKEDAKKAGREIGSAISVLGADVIRGKFSKLGGDMAQVGKSIVSNLGTIGMGIGTAGVVAALTGGGLRGLFKKLGGGAGEMQSLARDISIGTALKEAGITPVFVVNAMEIGNAAKGITPMDAIGAMGASSGATAGGTAVATGAGIGVGGAMAIGGAALTAGLVAFNSMIPEENKAPSAKGFRKAVTEGTGSNVLGAIAEAIGGAMDAYGRAKMQERGIDPDTLKKSVQEGVIEGMSKATEKKKVDPVQYTVPSDVRGRGNFSLKL